MNTLFDPRTTRKAQIATLSALITNATTSQERAFYLRRSAYSFAFILKRFHANFHFHGKPATRPLEHIEVIHSMADNWRKDFAAIPLTESHKEPLAAFREEIEQNPLEAIESLLGVGFKVSVIWSDSSASFIVTVIGTDATKYNSKKVLSSFSDDLEEALFMAAYKVFRVCPDAEWPTQQEQSRWG